MQPDLLERARSAVTQDEECAVLRAAVCHFITDAMQALPLIDIIVAVRSGRAPRPVLLGVVAALVPHRREEHPPHQPDDQRRPDSEAGQEGERDHRAGFRPGSGMFGRPRPGAPFSFVRLLT